MDIKFYIDRTKTLRNTINSLEFKNNELEKFIIKNTNYINIITESKAIYQKIIDDIYEQSIGELKTTLNLALNYIFYDKNFEVNIELNDKRGKSLDFYLIDKQKNIEVDTRDSVGNGVRVVISCILHIYYLLSKNSRFLFLDEAYSNLSVSYVSRFFEFLNKLCVKKDFIIVLISHDERFFPYCDKVYVVNDGIVTEVNKYA